MGLQDLREFLDQPVLTLPIGGRDYIVRPCTAATWLRLQEIAARRDDLTAAAKAAEVPFEKYLAQHPEDALNTMPEFDLYRLTLGPTFEEMLQADVTGPEMQQAGLTAFHWQLGQNEIAEAIWRGKAKAPETVPTTPTSTGAATTTRRRASTSSTTNPKKSKPASGKRKSPGTTSSPNGS